MHWLDLFGERGSKRASEETKREETHQQLLLLQQRQEKAQGWFNILHAWFTNSSTHKINIAIKIEVKLPYIAGNNTEPAAALVASVNHHFIHIKPFGKVISSYCYAYASKSIQNAYAERYRSWT